MHDNRYHKIQERHRHYEANKEAITVDLLTLGKAATQKKWDIPNSTIIGLTKRWLTEEQRLNINANRGTPPGRPAEILYTPTTSTHSNGRLPPFPLFSDTWQPEVQLQWLEVYSALALAKSTHEP